MNPKSFVPVWCRQIGFTAVYVAACAFLTGCPHNEYTVELKPTAKGMGRTLSFCRLDGSSLQAFPSNELAAITAVYPAGAIKDSGGTNVATANFASVMPKDIGGSGVFTNLTTSLGSAGFYSERFRGNDDLAERVARQNKAADQLTELTIGWAKTEFGKERGYKQLHAFLEKDFRQDLKNAGMYFWVGEVSDLANTNAPGEFMARFAHYLYERGYVKLTDTPQLYAALNDGHTGDLLWPKLIRRTVAKKMGLDDTTAPKSFAVFDDADTLAKSWDKYLAGTEQYRAKVAAWQKKHDPQEKQPDPDVVVSDLGKELSGSFEIFGDEPDHLAVKLALAHAPIYSNGKWDDGQVTWDAQLDPARALPVFCCASWGDPDEAFQKNHFGAVVLTDDGLAEYCLWQNGLAATRAQEWETFLSGLQPGGDLRQKVAQFQFAGASDSETNHLAIGRDRLVKALGN